MSLPFNPINPIQGNISPISTPSVGKALGFEGAGKAGENTGEFGNMFMSLINTTNGALSDAGKTAQGLLSGQLENIHDMTIAGEKAKIMLHLTTQLASKMSTACTTLFQMQL